MSFIKLLLAAPFMKLVSHFSSGKSLILFIYYLNEKLELDLLTMIIICKNEYRFIQLVKVVYISTLLNKTRLRE